MPNSQNIQEGLHVKNDFPIPSIVEFNRFGKQFTSRWGSSKTYREVIKTTYQQAISLYEPQLAWKFVSITSFSSERIIISPGIELKNKVLLKFMEGSEALILCAATIGPKFDILLELLSKEKKILDQLITDMLANFLIETVCVNFLSRIKVDEIEKGNMITNSFQPGESSWELTDQKIFFDLLQLDKIGLTLSKNMVISPTKSETFALGWTSGKFTHPEYIRCQFCKQKHSCRYYNRILKCNFTTF